MNFDDHAEWRWSIRDQSVVFQCRDNDRAYTVYVSREAIEDNLEEGDTLEVARKYGDRLTNVARRLITSKKYDDNCNVVITSLDLSTPGNTDAFRDAVIDDDELGVVIRGHLYVEAALNRFISLRLTVPEEAKLDNYRWEQKITLSQALGLIKDYEAPLRKLGRIRNKFAHQPEAHITADDLNGLYGALSENDREVVLDAYKQTKAQVEEPLEAVFRSLSHKNQFTLIIVAIHMLILAAIKEVERTLDI